MPAISPKVFGLGLASVLALTACSTELSSPEVLMEPAVESAPAAADSSARSAARDRVGHTPYPKVRSGVVTAGDMDDTRNLAAFQAYQRKAARETGLPLIYSDPLVFRVVDPSGKAAPGMAYTLRRPGAAQPLLSGYTGVDGHVTVFRGPDGRALPKKLELRLFSDGVETAHHTLKPQKSRQVITAPASSSWNPEFLDLVFVFDTTGSMGDELQWLTTEFRSIVKAVRASNPDVNMRFGLIAYRDKGDAYVTRNFGFTKSPSTMQGWLAGLNANGGGDYPEASDRAFKDANTLNWRRGKGERILFHIADAPARDSRAKAYLKAAQQLASKNVQIFGLAASGTGPEAEFLMRQAALISDGRYIFLTDDSGVGLAHAEPTIPCYKVTALKSLLVRVLRSELSGHRQEAKAGSVVRSVGNYSRGVCAQ